MGFGEEMVTIEIEISTLSGVLICLMFLHALGSSGGGKRRELSSFSMLAKKP